MTSPNQLSFLPDDYLERKARRRTNALCAGLFVVVLGVIGVTFSVSERSLRSIEAERTRIETEYTEAARRIQQVQELKDKQQKMARQAELTDSLLERVPRSFLLAELTNSLPATVSLLDLALDSVVRTPPPAPIPTTPPPPVSAADAKRAQSAEPVVKPKQYDVKLKVTGIADNDVQVAQFITKLNASPLFRDVNLVISDEYELGARVNDKGGDKLRKFQIEMSLRRDAEVKTQSEPTRTAAVELNVK